MRDLIVIPTIPGDIHACVVAEAVNYLGLRTWAWFSSNVALEQKISLNLDAESTVIVVEGGTEFRFSIDEVLTFWNRRLRDMHFGAKLHPADRESAASNISRFRSNIISILNVAGVSVNDFYQARKAENKALQLYYARAVGLLTPATLMSNCREDIAKFITLSSGPSLTKAFQAACWQTTGGLVGNHSAIVVESDLPSEELMQADAMIFQPYVDKNVEVRVTWFSDCPIAVCLHSQDNPWSKVDWRTVSPAELKISTIELPTSIAQKCKTLMQHLGIVFCCMDFIVSPDGEWNFLELNQMGQFLWIEEINPSIDTGLGLIRSANNNWAWTCGSKAKAWLELCGFKDAAYNRQQLEVRCKTPCQPACFYDEIAL